MTLLIKDRVQEVTTSSGTGPILLGTSFIAGYVDIGTAIGNGNTTPYVITDTTNNVYEIGVGQYILANTSLLRLQVLASSNANALVNFVAGAKNIFVDVPAAYISLTVRGLNQFASTTSANLASIISDAVGTGPLVFANNAVFVTPTLGVATGTSLTLSTALPIASGGTNSTATPTAGGIGYGTGTTHAYNAVGTAGQVLTSAGAGVPTWSTPSAGATIVDDTTTNATRYIMLGSANTGSYTSANTSSTKLYFNPSTGILGATIFQSLSDETQKTDIVEITDAVSTVSELKGVEFNWKETNNKSSGVIAQQLESILPHLVETNDLGLKSVNYSGIIGYLIESVKELSERVIELEGK